MLPPPPREGGALALARRRPARLRLALDRWRVSALLEGAEDIPEERIHALERRWVRAGDDGAVNLRNPSGERESRGPAYVSNGLK